MKKIKLLGLVILTCCSLALTGQEKGMSVSKEKVNGDRPFIVHDRSSKVSRVDIRKDLKGVESIIQIEAVNASGGSNLASSSRALGSAVISSVNIVSGSYNQTRELSRTARGMSLQLLDVVYPCRIRINVTDQHAEIEIKEPGFWKISLGLTN
jgi:hypothetical protein